jgi:hypothetical protein
MGCSDGSGTSWRVYDGRETELWARWQRGESLKAFLARCSLIRLQSQPVFPHQIALTIAEAIDPERARPASAASLASDMARRE